MLLCLSLWRKHVIGSWVYGGVLRAIGYLGDFFVCTRQREYGYRV